MSGSDTEKLTAYNKPHHYDSKFPKLYTIRFYGDQSQQIWTPGLLLKLMSFPLVYTTIVFHDQWHNIMH